MALFKIFKGVKSCLPPVTSSQDGYCYFTTDDGMFYIDYKNVAGELERKALNASDAKTLLGAQLETVLTESDEKIPTSKAVLSEIARVDFTIAEIDSILKEKVSKSNRYAVTLEATSWSGDVAPYTYTITIPEHENITDLIELLVGDEMTTEQIITMQMANIVKAEWTSNTTLVLYSYGNKPTVNAPITIIVRKD